MKNILNDKELNALGKELSKPRNEAADAVGWCNLHLITTATDITIAASRGPNKSVKGRYNVVRQDIIECVTKYVSTIKRFSGPYQVDDTNYKNFFGSVERVEEAIDVAVKVNPDAIIISNFWYSIKPVIVSLVNLLTGHSIQ